MIFWKAKVGWSVKNLLYFGKLSRLHNVSKIYNSQKNSKNDTIYKKPSKELFEIETKDI